MRVSYHESTNMPAYMYTMRLLFQILIIGRYYRKRIFAPLVSNVFWVGDFRSTGDI